MIDLETLCVKKEKLIISSHLNPEIIFFGLTFRSITFFSFFFFNSATVRYGVRHSELSVRVPLLLREPAPGGVHAQKHLRESQGKNMQKLTNFHKQTKTYMIFILNPKNAS